MGDFLGSYYYTLDAPSSKLALLRAEQPVSVLPMDAIHQSQTSDLTAHRATTHARWTALEFLHTRDIPLDALVPQPDMENTDNLENMVIEKATDGEGDADADGGELEIPVASMSLFEPGTGLITLPLSLSCVSGRGMDGVNREDGMRCVPCAPGDSPMPKLQRVCEIGIVDAKVPVPDFAETRAAALKSASLRSSLMRFIGRRGLK